MKRKTTNKQRRRGGDTPPYQDAAVVRKAIVAGEISPAAREAFARMRRRSVGASERRSVKRESQLRNGELAAARVVEHERFIAMHANNWSRSYRVDFDDLMQEGRLAVAHASGKYEDDRGATFLSYARWWIRSYMQTFAYRNCNQVRVPVPRFHELNPSEVSLDMPILDDEPDGPTWGETILHHYVDDEPMAAILARDAARVLRRAIAGLPAKLRLVMEARLAGENDVEIAPRLGCTHQNVSLLNAKAIEFLRRNPNVRELRDKAPPEGKGATWRESGERGSVKRGSVTAK